MFTKSDRRAIIILAIIAIALLAGIVLFGNKKEDQSKSFEGDMQSYSDSRESRYSGGSKYHYNSPYSKRNWKKGYFDPNTVDSATLVDLGLNRGQARNFIHYRNAGAVFRKPLDIAKVYSLDDDDIDRLLPLVRIADKYKNRRSKYPIERYSHEEYNYPKDRQESVGKGQDEESKSTENHPHSDKFTTLTKVDPNTADTTLLQKIPGIGSYISKWIVDRRNKVGGFYSTDQLLEVKNFDPELREWFEIKAQNITKINLSKMSFGQMAKHPYIGYDKAIAISRYKRLYGAFKDLQSIKSSNIFTDEELEKLKPYLEY